MRPRLKRGRHVRDEEHQARELTKTLGILDAEGVDGAFVWTFADPWLTHSAELRHDLDMTATSLVKTYARGQVISPMSNNCSSGNRLVMTELRNVTGSWQSGRHAQKGAP